MKRYDDLLWKGVVSVLLIAGIATIIYAFCAL